MSRKRVRVYQGRALYKVFTGNMDGTHSRQRLPWSLPTRTRPGRWQTVKEKTLQMCVVGLHVFVGADGIKSLIHRSELEPMGSNDIWPNAPYRIFRVEIDARGMVPGLINYYARQKGRPCLPKKLCCRAVRLLYEVKRGSAEYRRILRAYDDKSR